VLGVGGAQKQQLAKLERQERDVFAHAATRFLAAMFENVRASLLRSSLGALAGWN
jgi:hypothetical protein